MSIDKAKDIALFFRNNNIRSVNLMGGEFFCNSHWYEIFDIILSEVISARLVTNGDWANNEEVKAKLTTLINNYSNVVRFAISKDRWHTNKNVEDAATFLDSLNTILLNQKKLLMLLLYLLVGQFGKEHFIVY